MLQNGDLTSVTNDAPTHRYYFHIRTWVIQGAGDCLGELRKITSLYVVIPTAGSLLDDVKGGYGSQAAAMNAIAERTGGTCVVRG